MASISITKRCNFLNSGESVNVVIKEIASHRHPGKAGVTYLDKNGAIDPEMAGKSFTKFKEKFQAQIESAQGPKKQNPLEKEDKNLNI